MCLNPACGLCENRMMDEMGHWLDPAGSSYVLRSYRLCLRIVTVRQLGPQRRGILEGENSLLSAQVECKEHGPHWNLWKQTIIASQNLEWFKTSNHSILEHTWHFMAHRIHHPNSWGRCIMTRQSSAASQLDQHVDNCQLSSISSVFASYPSTDFCNKLDILHSQLIL